MNNKAIAFAKTMTTTTSNSSMLRDSNYNYISEHQQASSVTSSDLKSCLVDDESERERETERISSTNSQLQISSSSSVNSNSQGNISSSNNNRQTNSNNNNKSQNSANGGQTSTNTMTIQSGMSVNKQHLSARVKTITAKLLESHGAELRRTLFSLRQIFQDDPDLATEFIESDGLECLLKVAINADQIHQNYILRALGQLIAYPSGMNGLTRHNETIQWLYTLVGSQHRLVVKTSIKLLLLFVEHSDNNCLHFCRAIKSVEESKGKVLWTNLIDLFKQENNLTLSSSNQQTAAASATTTINIGQDVSILIDAMTLINKTLAGIPDQDTYYDFVDPLEELNLNSIASKCAKLDTQLKEQFELYEQVLKTEDDNEDEDENSINEANLNDDNSKTNNTNKLSAVNNNKYQTRRKSKRNWSATTSTKNSSKTATAAAATASSSKMNDRYEMPSSTDSFQIRQQQLQKQSQLSKLGDESESSANTVVNDDNYESANESNDGSDKQTSSPASSEDASPKISTTTSSTTTTTTSTTTTTAASKLKLQPSKQQHLLHNPARQQQNGLARGKQQRASISSCSSSDSYASYGSGYASGSGNSTDLEHKQKVSTTTNDQSENARSNATGILVKSNNNFTNHAQGVVDGEEVDDEEDDDEVEEEEEEEEEEDDSQLKQHLSELEQLTDELASRNIFGTLSQPTQSTSKHFSSTIKSTSSNSSSILSTGSNLSSLSATQANSDIQQQQQQQQQSLDKFLVPSSTKLATNSDSRSTSATPTSIVQPNTTATATSSSLYSSPSYLTNQNATGTINNNNEQIAAYPSSNSKPSNHHYTASVTNSAQQPSSTTVNSSSVSRQEPYYHNLFQWEQLVSKGVTRPLLINDLDFTDLRDEDDCDLLNSNNTNGNSTSRARNQAGELLTISIPGAQQQILNDQNSIDSGTSTGSPKIPTTPVSAPPPMPPPPISPWFNTISGSRPQSQFMSSPSPPYNSSGEFNHDQSPANQSYPNYSRNSVCLPQAITPLKESLQNQHFNTLQPVTSLRSASSMSSLLFGNKYANKRKKTMKLFWKEVREDRSLLSKLTRKRTIWDELKPVQVDTQKLEHLFESKAKDLLLSKSRNGLDGLNQRKVKITVLDAKRSNAINIGMTKLPPMRTIKTAILKMDSSIMNREGIEKILTTMMPTEEEKSRIIEAQLANPDTPLGTAEQFLLNLASISALEARLKLWAFQLDYAQIEKEVAEPLMDLKQAIEEIERSETFRIILGTLLAIGNFLNSTNVKGFQIDYLEKVPEVKDTVHKHSLLHHLCLFIQEKYDPELTNDLYSEFSAVNRASKVDYTEVAKNLKKMQQDCKASWDYLKIVAKHDGLANMMNSCGSLSTTTTATSSSSSTSNDNSSPINQQPKPSGKLNNLSKLSMITTVISSDNSSSSSNNESQQQQQAPTTKQLKTKVSDFLTDCAERIMVLIVIHRRVMNRFQKLLVYLGCPSHQIKQTQPQQVLKIINEFALEYRTKRERVREMLLKKQQCQHHHNHSNRWQLNRTRWAGSQQCIDSLGYNHHSNRPCSTTSSCADSMCTISLAGDARHQSIEPNNHLANQHHMAGGNNRTSSPSGFSQISNYSDYLFDHSCCNSRQQSITPVPLEKGLNHYSRIRPNSMSISMFDLQQQQQHQNADISALNSSCNGTNNGSREGVDRKCMNSEDEIHGYSSSSSSQQKDEQLRRLLGARKSLDETCNELYQMSHWSSTMARVVRRPPPRLVTKNRTVSMDSQIVKDDEPTAFNTAANVANTDESRQSSYYKHLHDNGQCRDDSEQNSDEEILQSLVRNVTAKSSSGSNNNNHDSNNLNGSHSNRSTANPHSAVTKGARNKILSRFNCDRKSLRRTLRSGIELSNVG